MKKTKLNRWMVIAMCWKRKQGIIIIKINIIIIIIVPVPASTKP